jgi:hypothetical protein
MTSQRIAQTNQHQNTDKSQESGMLHAATKTGVQFEEEEAQALNHKAFSKDFSQLPAKKLFYFHGGSNKFIDSALQFYHDAKVSEGELGSKGMYYWKDDENAALVSAVLYNKSKKWAVMKIEINKEVSDNNNYKMLTFKSKDTAPGQVIKNGRVTTQGRILGVHYQFLQDNLNTKLGEANKDKSIEGDLPNEYEGMTGREFFDSFDLVTSPTKADEYKHDNLKQVRANNNALANLIYGNGPNGERNTFTKTWEGEIKDEGQYNTIKNMGMSQKKEVPDKLIEFNGKEGTTVKKL